MIVIYDDCDIDVGTIRIRAKGSAGTHKGMQSVLLNTESDEFPRVRVGIGPKPEYFDIKDFVLGKFTEAEKETMAQSFGNAADAVLSIVAEGCEKTMSRFNSARKK